MFLQFYCFLWQWNLEIKYQDLQLVLSLVRTSKVSSPSFYSPTCVLMFNVTVFQARVLIRYTFLVPLLKPSLVPSQLRFHYPKHTTLHYKYKSLSSPLRKTKLSTYVRSVKSLNSLQIRVMAVTKASGSFTLEASPLLQINDSTTTSTLQILFVYSKARLELPSRKQGVI